MHESGGRFLEIQGHSLAVTWMGGWSPDASGVERALCSGSGSILSFYDRLPCTQSSGVRLQPLQRKSDATD